MTAQLPEWLRHEGQELAMCTTPLDDYFVLGGRRPDFDTRHSTMLWRGYVGRWEITQGRLYLVGLGGRLHDGAEACLATVFPGFPERAFAHWYCDTLRIPQGRLLKSVRQGFASRYERDLLIDVEQGVVGASTVRHNGTPGDGAA
jgi:hypothetical protein